MTHPAAYVVTGVVIAVAAIIAYFSTQSENKSKTKPMRYGSGRSRDDNERRPSSPPPSPPPSSFTCNRGRRRKSPERQSNSPGHGSARESTMKQSKICTNCGESPYVKIYPCNHESLCKGCFSNYLETNDTCPACDGRIDSCSPTLPPFGKCKSCRKFTKLFKFLPCKHSLSLCISCFEEQGEIYKECPECENHIRGYEPSSGTSGVCLVCEEFTRFAVFVPCGHANFCRKHAEQYLKDSDQECIDCGKKVMEVA